MTSDRVALGQRIRALREQHGYKRQADFAQALSISAPQLSLIERGLRRIDTILLRRIADLLGTSMDAFFPRFENQEVTALARRGDADDAAMQTMIEWASDLRIDIDRVSMYLGPDPL